MPCIVIQLLQSKPTKYTLVIISFTTALLRVSVHEGPSSGNQL